MNQTIDVNWIPDKRSTDSLKSNGYSVKQLNHIRRCFIRRHMNKEIPNASAAYSMMVRSSGAGHDIKAPDLSAEIAKDAKRDNDIANRSKEPEAKLAAVKDIKTAMTKDQAIDWIMKQRNQ